MKKKIITIGLMLVFLIVGLSGCSEKSSGMTSINDIRLNQNKYINQTVTVQAYYSSPGNDEYYYRIYNGSAAISAINTKDVVKPTELLDDSLYEFEGIVRYGKTNGNEYADDVYLEVAKIKAI